jgi:hypothetical protein
MDNNLLIYDKSLEKVTGSNGINRFQEAIRDNMAIKDARLQRTTRLPINKGSYWPGQGPQGLQGPTGSNGSQGPQGLRGLNGSNGHQRPTRLTRN